MKLTPFVSPAPSGPIPIRKIVEQSRQIATQSAIASRSAIGGCECRKNTPTGFGSGSSSVKEKSRQRENGMRRFVLESILTFIGSPLAALRLPTRPKIVAEIGRAIRYNDTWSHRQTNRS
jgi:hypothetical protein